MTMCQSSSASTSPSSTSPEAALGGEVRGVEHDDLMMDPHGMSLARPRAVCRVVRSSRTSPHRSLCSEVDMVSTPKDGPVLSGETRERPTCAASLDAISPETTLVPEL